MVIQRDTDAPIWGKANPEEQITVTCSWGNKTETTADEKGNWMTKIKTPKAGGPYTITIRGENELILENVLSGDVWVCGGQSNMDFALQNFVKNPKVPAEIAQKYAKTIAGEYPNIRTILLEKQYRAEPQEDIVIAKAFQDSWQANIDSLINGQTTAIGFFFGRNLQEHLNVPIGLIDANKGGTRIHLWTSAKALGTTKIAKEVDGVAKGSSVLFNGMVSPLMPFAIKGVIWYQGEANSKTYEAATDYSADFQKMIRDWRSNWAQGDFPFLFVQLAAFHQAIDEPVSEKNLWPYVRESQENALSLPSTGMASAIDLGLQKNIHPWMKEEVGNRLALAARNVAYNERVVALGPTFQKMEIKKNEAIIHFKNIGSGLVVKQVNLDGIQLNENELKGFIICGKDKKFYYANAKVKGDKVIVWHPEIEKPVAVRYAWADFPVCNLYNREGLPVNSFRTDK